MRGRDHEMQVLTRCLREAEQGRGGVVLIEGDPGTGKTALLTEMTTQATSQRFWVAKASADELSQRLSFAPLLAALRNPVAGLGAALSGATADAGAGTPESWTPPVREISGLLERFARDSPVLISLDDLHWSDPATLFALRLLTRQLAAYPLIWGLSRRTSGDDGDSGVLFDLLDGDGAARLTLGPLAADEAANLIADLVGARPDPGFEALAAGAGGNPHLVTELAGGLLDENRLEVRQGTATVTPGRLPRRIQTVARHRLEGLTAQARYLLGAAAVLGPAFRLDDMGGMLSMTAARVLTLINEAVESGTLVVRPEDFTFRHELIRAAVAETVPASAQQALHRQFGEILLARGGSATAAAEHLMKGVQHEDPAAIASLDAAARETMLTAPATAADLAVRALELTSPSDPARFPRVLRAAETLAAAARLEQAGSVLHAALAQPQSAVSDTQLRCVLASVLAMRGDTAQAGAEADIVLRRGQLDGQLGDEAVIAQLQALSTLGENTRARGMAETVLAAFGEHGEPALAAAMSVLSMTCWDEGQLDMGLHLARETVRRTRGVSADSRHFQPLLGFAARLIDLRQTEQAEAAIQAAADGIAAFRPSLSEAIPQILRARVYLATGRVDDALRTAEKALGVAATFGVLPYMSLAHSLLSVIALRKGDLRSAGLHIRDRPDVSHYSHSYARTETLLARAQYVEAAVGPETAVEVLENLYADLPGHRHVLIGEPTASAWLARTAIAAGHPELATGVAFVADEIAKDNPAVELVAVAAAHCGGIVEQNPTQLAYAMERHPDPWARASAAEDLGNFMLATDNHDDAVEQFDSALSGYGESDAGRDLARVRRRLRRLGVRRRHWASGGRPDVGWASLTDTELATTILVAQGLSNSEAAEQMYVSAHTVAFHLRQVFRKLGITSRVELARLVAEQPPGWDGGDADSYERFRARG